MKDQPHIEVLLATYNGQDYIEAQIESILDQSHSNLHIIVRDDGSKDNTRSIIQQIAARHPKKITLLPFGQNLGVILNFSALMQQSHASYVMLSDQDDIWLKDKVAKTLAKIQELENTHLHIPVLVHTDLKVVDQQLNEISRSFCKYTQIAPLKARTLFRVLGQNVVTGCTAMMNQALVKKALPIPPETLMHDWWIALVAVAMGKIGFVNEQTILYRQHYANAVGAKSGNFMKQLSSFLQNKEEFITHSTKTLKRQEQQALKFLERYHDELSDEQKMMIEAFCIWTKGSFLERVRIAAQFGFLKNGLLKNIGSLLIPRR